MIRPTLRGPRRPINEVVASVLQDAGYKANPGAPGDDESAEGHSPEAQQDPMKYACEEMQEAIQAWESKNPGDELVQQMKDLCKQMCAKAGVPCPYEDEASQDNGNKGAPPSDGNQSDADAMPTPESGPGL